MVTLYLVYTALLADNINDWNASVAVIATASLEENAWNKTAANGHFKCPKYIFTK